MTHMQKMNWDHFKIKNENWTKAFEDLCYHLFCRKYRLKDGIRANYNQIGLETHPINDESGDLIGFQAKFFENVSSFSGLNILVTKSHGVPSKCPKLVSDCTSISLLLAT